MKKGIYTATVSIIVIAMVMASAFSLVSIVQSQEQKSLAKDIVEIKWKMQNSESIIRKSAADALADSSFDSSCTYNQSTLHNAVDSYIGNTLSDSFGNCNVEGLEVAGNQANTTISFELACVEEVAGIEMVYKNTISYSKEITYFTDSTCHVDIKDLDTGECEVDKIIGQPVGCGS